MKSILGHGLLALGMVCAGAAGAQELAASSDVNPNKIQHRLNPGEHPSTGPQAAAAHGGPTAAALTAGGTAALSAITNHGGPVMGGAPSVHLIWYGNWNQTNGSDTPAGQAIVRDFMTAASGSNWMKINTGYTGGGTNVTGLIAAPVEANVGYIAGSRAKRLRDADIATIVTNYVNQHATPAQSNAIYFVLTSSDVTTSSGFCTQYCGWHTKGTIAGLANVKYSFVGNANRCLGSCAAQSVGPNGNAGVDGMVSVLAHELVETLSDPLLNAWYDASGAENADKCAWTFGSAQSQLPSGAWYNMTLGARKYLIQRNLAVNSKCYIDGVNLIQ